MQAVCFEEKVFALPHRTGAHAPLFTENGQTWLNLELYNGRECETVEELLDAAGSAGHPFSRWSTIRRLRQIHGSSALLKVSAPFSALMQMTRSDRMFHWLGGKPEQVREALTLTSDATVAACAEAVRYGARVISLVDPCAMPELLGDKRYRAFAADYAVQVIRRLLPLMDGSLIHLCSRLSFTLERMGYLTSEKISLAGGLYASAICLQARQRGAPLMGHHCLHDPSPEGGSHGYALRLNA